MMNSHCFHILLDEDEEWSVLYVAEDCWTWRQVSFVEKHAQSACSIIGIKFSCFFFFYLTFDCLIILDMMMNTLCTIEYNAGLSYFVHCGASIQDNKWQLIVQTIKIEKCAFITCIQFVYLCLMIKGYYIRNPTAETQLSVGPLELEVSRNS